MSARHFIFILCLSLLQILGAASRSQADGSASSNGPLINLTQIQSLSAICQSSSACPPSKEQKQHFDKALLQCELERKAKNCEAIEKKHPEVSAKFKKCDSKKFCEQFELSNRQAAACFRGYKNALIDLGIGIKDMSLSMADFIDTTWNDFKTNHDKKISFLKQCNQSLSCKRDLVKEDPRYANLSDEKLTQLSATFLYSQAQDFKSYKSTIDRSNPSQSLKIDPSKALNLSGEQQLKLNDLLKIARQKATEFNSEYQCMHTEAQTELECYILGNVIDPTLIAGYFFKAARVGTLALKQSRKVETLAETSIVKSGADIEVAATAAAPNSATPTGSRRNSVIPESIKNRNEFKDKYLTFSPASVEENAKWIDMADEGIRPGRFYLDIENSKMKDLNTTLKDKNLVTSLTNYHKDLTLKEIEKLQKKYPDLKIDKYSDPKAIRFAFSGKIPPSLTDELNVAFAKVNTEFAKYLKQQGLVRQTEKPEAWFRAGFAESADKANRYSRFGRTQANTNNVITPNDTNVQQALNQQLGEFQSLNSRLQKRFSGSEAREGLSLHEDVFDITRKNGGDSEKIKKQLTNRFGVSNLSEQDIADLNKYTQVVDEFSPGIRIKKREFAILDNADQGGLSADIIGLGSMNQKATADALARSKDVDQAILEARVGEREVTSRFIDQKESFQKAVHKVVPPSIIDTICSGDDCIGIVSRPLRTSEKMKILEGISETKHAGRYRLSFIPKGAAPEVRTELSAHGESIEKFLRKQLSGKISGDKLKGLTFGLDMNTQKLGEGEVGLIIGQSKKARLNTNERSAIDSAFKKALQQMNEDLKVQSGAGNYIPRRFP